MGTETNPYGSHQGNTLQKAKAYRRNFSIHGLGGTDEAHTPALFQDNITDISSEHANMTSVALPIKYYPDSLKGIPFLALFYDFEWRLTGHGEMDADSIRFRHIGKDILYLPIYYTDGDQIPAADPFYIDTGGMAHILSPDSPDSLMLFASITPENDITWNGRMLNAVFESSNSSDFTKTHVIHEINEIPVPYNRLKIKHPITCRYFRYRAPEKAFCNVSEITLYDLSGNKLEGIHIGTTGSFKDMGNTGDKAFDGDITTFYDAAAPEESWTGLDLGEDKKIAAIQYSPRFLGIGIYEGYEYELFCWRSNGWQSIEKKTATGETIGFNAPKDALMYLNNNTTKKKGKIFFFKNDQMMYYN